MTRKLLSTLAALLVGAVGTGGAVGPGDGVDECINADTDADRAGPPGFVAGLVPDFLSDLIGSLPVPNFVKGFFGAQTC